MEQMDFKIFKFQRYCIWKTLRPPFFLKSHSNHKYREPESNSCDLEQLNLGKKYDCPNYFLYNDILKEGKLDALCYLKTVKIII